MAPARRRSFWRFSLRELLLLILTTGACLGWGRLLYQKNARFSPTPFFSQNADWRKDIDAIIRDVTRETEIRDWAGAYGDATGPSSCERNVVYEFPLPSSCDHQFLAALRQRIKDKIVQSGGTVFDPNLMGDGINGHEGKDYLYGVYYRHVNVRGTVYVCLSRKNPRDACLFLIIYEQRAWP